MRKLLVAAVVLMLAGSWAMALKAARVEVSITKKGFVPAAATINVGDSVLWTNDDDRDHQISADDGGFASGKLKAGQTYEQRFSSAGSFGYSCSLHPREKGRIVVKK